MAVWDFKKQLALGEKAQARLQEIYHRPTLVYDGRAHDLVDDLANRIEVKTEMRSLADTENFFFEYKRDEAKNKPGGPWQAMQCGSNQFVIFFVKDSVYFVFDNLPALCRTILTWAEKTKAKPKRIMNKGWSALGYTVPRDVIKALYKEYRHELENG